jgi:hypothetical protein
MHVLFDILVGWLVGNHSLATDFGPYGTVFMNVCVVITIAVVMLLQNFGL